MDLDTARLSVRVVGALTLVCAGYGLYYNFCTFRGFRESPRRSDDPPHVREAFYTLSAICVVFYLLLTWIGVEFLLGHTDHWAMFVTVLVAEVIYLFALGILWARSPHAMSIGAASGISSGGLMAQWFILFPLWAPIVVWFARQRMLSP